MGENILGFFLTALFSPYGSEDLTKLLRQAVEDDECSSEIIRQLADIFEQNYDIMKKAIDGMRESYRRLKSNKII